MSLTSCSSKNEAGAAQYEGIPFTVSGTWIKRFLVQSWLYLEISPGYTQAVFLNTCIIGPRYRNSNINDYVRACQRSIDSKSFCFLELFQSLISIPDPDSGYPDRPCIGTTRHSGRGETGKRTRLLRDLRCCDRLAYDSKKKQVDSNRE